MEIKFWTPKGKYGFLSNFYVSNFRLHDIWYQTNEHYFQSRKFAGTNKELYVISLSSPADAAREGKRRDFPLREDWEQVKEEVMLQGLTAKFYQNEELKRLLLDTGNSTLIENSPYDYYWGVGRNGSGKNRLGNLLMLVRGLMGNVN